MKSRTVAVYGATGHTGRFVACELERRGVPVRKIARRAADSHWASASCDEPEALDRALDGADAVINCAGPFLDTAPAIIEAALRAGAHYFDLAAEQRSVRQSLATYHADAEDRGIVVLPAMAFYGGLADLLAAQLCTELRVVDEILIGVALDRWHPTAGTLRTGERNSARRLVVSGGRLAPLPNPAARGRWQFPSPFGELAVASVPMSEIITIARHLKAGRVESFINETPLQDLKEANTLPRASEESPVASRQSFVMDVFASGGGQSRRLAASGHDIYAVSAPLVVEACMRVLSHRPGKAGAFAPAELFDARDFLSALSAHIQVQSSSEPRPM